MSTERVFYLKPQEQLKIAMETFFGSEFQEIARQKENPEYLLESCRLIGVNGLIARPNNKAGVLGYYLFNSGKEHQSPQVWIFFSIPVIKLLDNVSLQVIYHLLFEIIEIVKESNFTKLFHSAEEEAYEKLVEDLRIIKDFDRLRKMERTRQLITFLLINQMMAGKPIVKIEDLLSEEVEFQKQVVFFSKLSQAFNKAKSRLMKYKESQILHDVRLQPYPSMFQVITNAHERRIKPFHMLMIKAREKYLTTVILISNDFLAEANEELIEISLCYELLYLLLERKYSRGSYERQIYALISSPLEEAEKRLRLLFTDESVNNALEEQKAILEKLIQAFVNVSRVD